MFRVERKLLSFDRPPVASAYDSVFASFFTKLILHDFKHTGGFSIGEQSWRVAVLLEGVKFFYE